MADQHWLDATPSKTAFTFGLVLGVAVMSILALAAIVAMLFNGGQGLVLGRADTNTPPPAQYPTTDPNALEPEGPPPSFNVQVTDQDHIRGNKDASVTIVEFSDFECPFCGRFAPTIEQAMTEYGDRVRLVYKHFPLESIHPLARPAAEASECAAEQGKFWEFHDMVFANQDLLTNDYLTKQIPTALGLDAGRYNTCITSGKYSQRVDDDYQLGLTAGVRGTPHTLINGEPVSGAESYAVVRAKIEAALAQ